MAKQLSKKEKDFIDDTVKLLNKGIDADKHNREAAIDDLKFANPADPQQWSTAAIQDRKTDGRPCLTINLFPQYIKQVTGDIRHNRPRAKIHPDNSTADVHIAKIREGMISDSEYQSNSDYIYVEAGTMVTTCGYGAWRVNTRYTEENPFIQEMYDELIENPFTVVMDPEAKDPIYADADWCFIRSKISKDDFKDQYPDAEVPSEALKPGPGLSYEHWYDKDTVTVAEYFARKKEKKTMCQMADGSVVSEADAKDLIKKYQDNLQKLVTAMSSATPHPPIGGQPAPSPSPVMPGGQPAIPGQMPGSQPGQMPPQMAPPDPKVMAEQKLGPEPKIMKTRETEVTKIKHYKMTAAGILSKNGLEGEDFPGKYIPVILVTGDRTNVEGKRYISGLVRNAKDAARNVNYWHCLSLDTPLPTPSGWTTMGGVKPGDKLFDEKGDICTVLGTSPINHGRECFRITFDDGSSIVTDRGHLWQVEERHGNVNFWETRIVNTGELQPSIHCIRTTEPLKTAEAKLAVHPYVLGAWLGDGDTDSVRITVGGQDHQGMIDTFTQFQIDISKVSMDSRNNGVGWFYLKGQTAKLREIGVLGNKHIPSIYLRASYNQRMHLLQGLMDTDGSITQKCQCSFTTTLKTLADGFSELLRSLGIKSVFLYREGRLTDFGTYVSNGKPQYQFSFTPPREFNVFRLKRKADRQQAKTKFHPRRTNQYRIKSIEQIDSVKTKCVMVDSPSKLFLAGEAMIPTHNTSAAERIALEPKAPWIGTPKQFEGFEEDYASANVKNFAMLKYNPDDSTGQLAPPPQRQGPGQVPAALFTQLQTSLSLFESAIGMNKSDLGAAGPERTGAAINARQRPGDIRTFSYIDNLARGIQHAAKIKNEIIPELFDTQRDVRLRNIDETETYVPINTTVKQAYEAIINNPDRYKGMNTTKLIAAMQKSGPDAKFNDITAGRYSVKVTVGPSYATQRSESSETMLRLVSALPKQMGIAADLIVKNMDIQDADVLADRLKKMLPPGMAKPNPDEPPPQPPQPTPQQQLMMAKVKTEQIKQQKETLKAKVEMLQMIKDTKESESGVRQEILNVLAELHNVGTPPPGITGEQP